MTKTTKIKHHRLILCTYWLSGRAGRENIWLEVCTSWARAKYFPARPDLTQSISILWYDHLLLKILKLLFEPIRSDGRAHAEQLLKSFYNKKKCHLFLHVEQGTYNSSKNTTHFLIFFSIAIHARKPTESWHKAFLNSLVTHMVISQSECPILVRCMYLDTQWKCRSRLLRLVQKLMKTLIKTLEF